MRCPVHLSIGQEAAAAGVCQHLLPSDVISSAHRSHAHYLAKGGDVNAMLAELYGKKDGCGGRGGSMHLLDLDAGVLPCLPIIGASISTGVGAAFSFVQRGMDSVSVVFLGDAAVEEGLFHECANFAVLKNLPVLFVCENNKYSVCTPLQERQPGRPITDLAVAHAMKTAHADGNDATAVFDVASAAIERARRGNGPTFLQLDTYRIQEHCGPLLDLELGFRDQDEYRAWSDRDPLKIQRQRLEEAMGWSNQDEEDLRREIDGLIAAAYAFAKAAPFPEIKAAGDHVHA